MKLEMSNWFHKPNTRAIIVPYVPIQLSDSQERRLSCSGGCECGGWTSPPDGYRAAYPHVMKPAYLKSHIAWGEYGPASNNLVIYPEDDADAAEE